MTDFLAIAQILVSVILIILILLQQRGTALGSAFGGQEGGFYATRRGLQKKIFWATVVMGVLFVALALANLIL
ncbi:MAG: preprotein translocase subunit SecG [Candidatus Nealsonbacteria bacterium CG09_land_8_20_14_0_10_42_14]|uniref:Protein-export membrane protein SecG n=1 Tax=Candidatus Nealsonbacteria bacterium CG09_land_8_20_14_0_10_42_14 TaxID=1974707 RepID=A0A2H0WXQ7_9BACT|nr:MAG: preprotein translocase subunit SecG [Candidatus Nealsonbacteria bacterium CG09_land_8_20_14_0_10_42_14]